MTVPPKVYRALGLLFIGLAACSPTIGEGTTGTLEQPVVVLERLAATNVPVGRCNLSKGSLVEVTEYGVIPDGAEGLPYYGLKGEDFETGEWCDGYTLEDLELQINRGKER